MAVDLHGRHVGHSGAVQTARAGNAMGVSAGAIAERDAAPGRAYRADATENQPSRPRARRPTVRRFRSAMLVVTSRRGRDGGGSSCAALGVLFCFACPLPAWTPAPLCGGRMPRRTAPATRNPASTPAGAPPVPNAALCHDCVVDAVNAVLSVLVVVVVLVVLCPRPCRPRPRRRSLVVRAPHTAASPMTSFVATWMQRRRRQRQRTTTR